MDRSAGAFAANKLDDEANLIASHHSSSHRVPDGRDEVRDEDVEGVQHANEDTEGELHTRIVTRCNCGAIIACQQVIVYQPIIPGIHCIPGEPTGRTQMRTSNEMCGCLFEIKSHFISEVASNQHSFHINFSPPCKEKHTYLRKGRGTV